MNRTVIAALVALLVATPVVWWITTDEPTAVGPGGAPTAEEGAPPMAQEGASPGQQGEAMPPAAQPDDEMMQQQQRLSELEQELTQIQEQVMDENEDLQARADELEDRLFTAMEDKGYDGVRDHVARLEELVERLEAGDLDQQELQAELEDNQEMQMELQAAQQEVMQDPEFAEQWSDDRQQLIADLETTMTEDYPESQELIQEMERIQSEMTQGIEGMPQGGMPQQ